MEESFGHCRGDCFSVTPRQRCVMFSPARYREKCVDIFHTALFPPRWKWGRIEVKSHSGTHQVVHTIQDPRLHRSIRRPPAQSHRADQKEKLTKSLIVLSAMIWKCFGFGGWKVGKTKWVNYWITSALWSRKHCYCWKDRIELWDQ